MTKKNSLFSLLDLLRNYICLLKLSFLASLSLNFSTISLDILSKFTNKCAQKVLIFLSKANYARGLFLFFFLTLIFNSSWFSHNLFSEEIKQEEEIGGGTVIVTYEIFPREDMIHRIRFWLRNEKLEAEMYPKGQNFVDDKESISRTVVIENLKPGKYEIQFLVPNKEGDFETIGPREILIEKESTLKIDQKIKTI